MKKYNVLKLLFSLLITFSLVGAINNVEAAGGSGASNQGSGNSTSRGNHADCGYQVLPPTGIVGYRLSVVRLKDDGEFDKIVKQIDYSYAADGSDYIDGYNIFVNKSKNLKCKTRYGILNDSDCKTVEWKSMSGKKYYKESERPPKKFPTGSGEYDWTTFHNYYNKKADPDEGGSYDKTLKLLKELKVPTTEYAKKTLESKSNCADGSVPVDGFCVKYECDVSKSSVDVSGAFTHGFNSKYDSNKGACVSYSTPTGYGGVPADSKAHHYSDVDKEKKGSYTDTTYSCTNGGTLNWDSKTGARSCKTKSGGKTSTLTSSSKTKYVSVTCNAPFRDSTAADCVVVHGYDTYTNAAGTAATTTDIRYKVSTLKPMEVCDQSVSQVRNLWIMIEPMLMVQTTCDGIKTYYGTVTEIASLKYKINSDDETTSKYGFQSYSDNFLSKSKNYWFMTEDTYTLKIDGTNHKFTIKKLLKKVSTPKNNNKITTKSWKYLYKKDGDKTYGVGVGNVWLGLPTKDSSAKKCETKPITCDDDPNINITDCVTSYMQKGYEENTALGICNVEKCDIGKTACDYCDDDGRRTEKILSVSDLVKWLLNGTTIGSTKIPALNKKADRDTIKNRADEIKTAWKDNACSSPVYDINKNVKDGKFICEDYFTNKGKIEIGTAIKKDEKTQSCETSQINKNGTYMGSLGSCSIFCIETADLVFPGNVKNNDITDSIHASDSFEWPSKSNDGYKLQIDYDITCKAINPSGKDGSSCGQVIDKNLFTSTIESKLYNSIKLTYQNDNGKPDYNLNLLELNKKDLKNKEYSISTDDGKSWSQITSSALNDGNKIRLTTSYRYYLPENLNFYQDSVKDYYNTEQKDLGITPLTNIGVGRLATENIAKGTQKYFRFYEDGLQLNVVFGNNDSIGSAITDYKCNYSVYQGPESSECVCPEGTLHEGESLTTLQKCVHKDGEDEFCAKDIGIYCDTEWKTELFKNCTCDNCEKTTDISECVEKTNGDYDGCLYENCKEIEKCDSVCYDYKYCSLEKEAIGLNYIKITNYCYPTKKDMDNKNKKVCKECGSKTKRTTCPKCEDNDLVAYRTIDLENPFPGRNGNGETTAFSLNNTKGRYPGENWDNATWVKNKITNARDKKGNEIYNLPESEVLYSITLTPEDMRKIRDINKTTNYDAYKGVMTCDLDSEGKCTNNYYVARLLRNTLSGKIKGLCSNANNSSLVESCYQNSSSAKKYTYSN